MGSRSSSYRSRGNPSNQETDSPPLSPMPRPLNAQRPRDQQQEDAAMMPSLVSTSMPFVPPLSIDDEIRASNIGVYQEAGDCDNGGNIVIQDASLIQCPICNDTFSDEIFHCPNGHSLCKGCFTNLQLKVCPQCDYPNLTRNYGFERLLEAVTSPCKNKGFGCETILYVRHKLGHESTCIYTECFCPYPSCGFSNSSEKLYHHFNITHPQQATNFTFDRSFSLGTGVTESTIILQEENQGVIFVFNQSNDNNERRFELQCIGPPFLHGNGFQCTIKMRCWEIVLVANVIPTICRRWVPRPPENKFLTVPHACGVISEATLLIKKSE